MALPPISRSPPQAQPIRSAVDARAAAQRAFFDAALGRTLAPAAAPTVAAATPARPSAAIARPAPISVNLDTPPTRTLRPGSLLDISV